ncbi:MAG: RNA polymerase subunit sigma, partial [Erysipelotrichaceae bacterium]|nr:RNA polymerase subunit sigma [Erysipelotrichaceae bacterium]
MDDYEIVELYWQRSENAIRESDRKYGRYCFKIAQNILFDRSDSEECVNDTWLRAWESMPPNRPERLGAYLGRITRNLA